MAECVITRSDTTIPLTEGEARIDKKRERRASSCHGSLGPRVKRPSSGAFQSPAAENPSGDISAAEDPSAECGGEGSAASSRHDNLPRSPSMSSRNEVWKVEGVSTFSLGVLIRGHAIHINTTLNLSNSQRTLLEQFYKICWRLHESSRRVRCRPAVEPSSR